MSALLFFSLLSLQTMGSPSLSFSRPSMLPVGHGPFFDSIRPLGEAPRDFQLASSPNGVYGTNTGGKTWETVFNKSYKGFTTFAIPDASGKVHTMGDVEGSNLPNLTSVTVSRFN